MPNPNPPLRKHDFALDGPAWDLSALSLTEAPVEQLKKNNKANRIDLSNNLFVELPKSFPTLTHIVWLDLSKNKLKELPPQFGDLVKLQHLDLYGNYLPQLPPSFASLSKLKWLDLKQNPLEGQLKKVAGDCANAKQCADCAIKVVKFIKNENARIEKENEELKITEKINMELEKKKMESKRIEKEKKKAKQARKAARKAQDKLDLVVSEDHRIDSEENEMVEERGSSGLCKTLTNLVLFAFNIMMLLTLLTIAMGIGLHLHAGNKLHSMNDFVSATRNTFIKLADLNSFLSEVGLMVSHGLAHVRAITSDLIGNSYNK